MKTSSFIGYNLVIHWKVDYSGVFLYWWVSYSENEVCHLFFTFPNDIFGNELILVKPQIITNVTSTQRNRENPNSFRNNNRMAVQFHYICSFVHTIYDATLAWINWGNLLVAARSGLCRRCFDSSTSSLSKKNNVSAAVWGFACTIKMEQNTVHSKCLSETQQSQQLGGDKPQYTRMQWEFVNPQHEFLLHVQLLRRLLYSFIFTLLTAWFCWFFLLLFGFDMIMKCMSLIHLLL